MPQEHKRHEIHFSEVDFEAIANTFARAHQLPVKDAATGVVPCDLFGRPG